MLFIWSKKAQKRWLAYALAYAGAHKNLPEPARHRADKAAAEATSTEDRLIVWFHALPDAQKMAQRGRRERRRFSWILAIVFLLAVVAGGATALSALSGDRDAIVNIIWLLGGLLGLHSLMFLLWAVVLLLSPLRGAVHGLGAALLRFWRHWALRDAGDNARLAVHRAFMDMLVTGPSGRWVASTISHWLWCGYLLGGIALLLIMLATRHMVFIWETTILSASDYAVLFDLLSRPVAFFGFQVPDAEAVAAAQWPGEMTINGTVWPTFILASLFVYGLLPRCLALLMSVLLARRALARTYLDPGRSIFGQVIPELAPVVRNTRIVDRAPDSPVRDPSPSWSGHHTMPPPVGPVAVLGLECAEPYGGWPPVALDSGVLDLGMPDGKRALDAALAQDMEIGRLIVVVDLVSTPDRGMKAALARIRAHVGDALVVLLSRQAACENRLGKVEARQRLSDWVAIAHAAGCSLDAILALDLDSADPAVRRSFNALCGLDE